MFHKLCTLARRIEHFKTYTYFIFRGNSMTNPNKGKWFKFNDTFVEEFEMNDASVEAECFGGTYKTKNNESSCK